jgi:hypothetical protein
MKITKFIISTFIIFIFTLFTLLSQNDKERVIKVDSTYIFKPSKPIRIYNPNETLISQSIGLDVAFTNSGLGLGMFYHYFLDNDNIIFANFYISGARNTDEIEYWDYNTGQWVVPNKINRLFLIPLTFGYTKILFSNSIAGTFKPFASIGVGPSFIFSTPYEKGWFEAWKYAKNYIRFGSYIEIGGYFKTIGNSIANAGIKYYYIPFGGDGLESIKGLPIKDFGGLVLSLSIGYAF